MKQPNPQAKFKMVPVNKKKTFMSPEIRKINAIIKQFRKDGDKFKLPDIMNPDSNCDCYGRGYDGVKTNGKKKEERKVTGYCLCDCIFKKKMKLIKRIENGEKIEIKVIDEKLNWENKDETVD